MKSDKRIIYPLLAKVGHKIEGDRGEQAKTLWKHYFDEEIETYIMKRLSTFRDVIDSQMDIADIIMLEEVRKYSLDYDYKRKPLSDGTTVPHDTVNDIVRYRAVVSTLREKKKLRAIPELVEFYQSRSKQKVRMRFSNKEDCLRHFLRALTQCVYPFKSYSDYGQLLTDLGRFNVTMDKLKNAKRTPFIANVVFNNGVNRRYIRTMLKALGYKSDNNYKEWIDLLIHKGLSNPVTMFD